MKELLELKITGLRKLAKEYEIPNFSSMTKAELINYVAIEQKGRTSSKIKIAAKPMIIPNMTVFASYLVQKLQKWQRIILIRCRHRK